ncbi:MDR family MFS transporter [Roseomonas sp. CCTCC AB2023176]|uniref:MDR family MFS transporter n=1 Tax=Roseomonas sp. CCTCC AB2023176 TaxID=3342640 RepID=UPI0035E0A166
MPNSPDGRPAAAPTTRRALVIASVMAALFMIAIEATIVSTAMPQIAGQLGDLHLYSWVFSSFLLTQTAATVAFGKLADLYGRKPVLLVGIGIFLGGSVLCGLAWSMPSLIAFRLIQGVGAGAIQPVCITVVGDLYPGPQRAKVQGYLASVWGVSSVIGPLVGAFMIGHLHWAWLFWINVPIGVAAAAGFAAYLHENIAPAERSVDVLGAAIFTVSVASLMVALTGIGASGHGIALAAAGLFAVSIPLFVLQERRARDPMMNFGLLGRRPIATANAVTLLGGMSLVGLTTFLPMYVQGVLRQSAMVAGFALTMTVLGWPIGATIAARQMARFGLRPILLCGAALLPVGAAFIALLGPGSSVIPAGVGSFVMGLGMGFLNSAAIMIVQGSVGWEERASATASSIFFRNLGSTLGAVALGAVLNLGLASGQGGAPMLDSEQIRQLLDAPTNTMDVAVQLALGRSLHATFLVMLGIAVLAVLAAAFVPRVALEARPATGAGGRR